MGAEARGIVDRLLGLSSPLTVLTIEEHCVAKRVLELVEPDIATALRAVERATREADADLAKARVLDEAAYLGIPDAKADVLADRVANRLRALTPGPR